ncbi:ABC-type nitrate/sulfonate/bicarbonate transport system permease component [Aequitasia blattaphilus]|uniref:ABC transporter permease n=1 Tax=Aequitasia blattaphilus TaxID=2949332 RepID=A0ABT1E8H3_9FIRM|nr:ABC transporter permease [Aequitasia blattaphilus]MCP1102120.1 ABC transporter permease [Aequitasia blattaphilus]MCR8614760.1 ABC transporter permease [Aequitasia blattaphilus]
MKRKLQNTTNKLIPLVVILVLLIIWQGVSSFGLIPKYMLPAPSDIGKVLVGDFPLLMENAKVTILEAFIGLVLGIAAGFIMAVLMDCSQFIYNALYPLMVITQTIPTVAIAPLLVLWFGYGIAPKVILIVIVTFFPIAVSLLEGFRMADSDMIRLMKTMGASKIQIFIFVKLPGSIGQFFASLKIAISYAIVGAVISEWLGGFSGLGVYMTKVRKAYSFDKMFAVIFWVSAISLILIKCVGVLQKKCMPWEEK